MKTTGSFVTSATVEQLRYLSTRPEVLNQVASLHDVRSVGETRLSARFTPTTPMGRVPMRLSIETSLESARDVRMLVSAARGAQVVDAELQLLLLEEDAGTRVTWTADVLGRGSLASVAQRILLDLATEAITSTLEQAAEITADLEARR